MEIKEEKERFVLLNDEQEEAGEMTWSNAGPEIMIIDHTFVDPTYRGQGLAEKLVAAGVEKSAQGREKKLFRFAHLLKKNLKKNQNMQMF